MPSRRRLGFGQELLIERVPAVRGHFAQAQQHRPGLESKQNLVGGRAGAQCAANGIDGGRIEEVGQPPTIVELRGLEERGDITLAEVIFKRERPRARKRRPLRALRAW